MKSNPWGGGSSPSIQNNTNLPEWENTVIESIGRVIGFWGFKENHGRIWSYLYLKGPTTSKELRDKLGISKGGMSMLLSDLENWNIIDRQLRTTTQSISNVEVQKVSESTRDHTARLYVAHEDFSSMIIKVLKIREQGLISATLKDLHHAQNLAKEASTVQKKSLQNMIDLAQGLNQVFDFICTSEHSLTQLQHVLAPRVSARPKIKHDES